MFKRCIHKCFTGGGEVGIEVIDGTNLLIHSASANCLITFLPFEFFDDVLFPYRVELAKKFCIFRGLYAEFSIVHSFTFSKDYIFFQCYVKALRDIELLDVLCPTVICKDLERKNNAISCRKDNLCIVMEYKGSHVIRGSFTSNLKDRAWRDALFFRRKAYGLSLRNLYLRGGDVVITNLCINIRLITDHSR